MTTWWTLLFEPLGVLMFRDHRPFDAGRDGIARSRFPYPSVFRGAIRSALFQAAGADFSKKKFGLNGELAELLGDNCQKEKFALRGPMLARCACRQRSCSCGVDRKFEYLLPWPADLVEVDGPKDDAPHFEVFGERPASADSACFRWDGHTKKLRAHDSSLPWVRGKLVKPSGDVRCLTPEGGKKYVEGGKLALLKGEDFILQSAVLQTEHRVGLARATRTRGRTLTAARGMLYTLLTYRLAEVARFAVEVDVGGPRGELLKTQLNALDGESIRLGGQSGHVRLQVIEHRIAPTWKAPAGPTKLWAWTPTLWDPTQPPPGLQHALGKAIRLGGFDMQKRQPRPLQAALDRGAVLRLKKGTDQHAVRRSLELRAKDHGVPPHSYGYGHWSTVE